MKVFAYFVKPIIAYAKKRGYDGIEVKALGGWYRNLSGDTGLYNCIANSYKKAIFVNDSCVGEVVCTKLDRGWYCKFRHPIAIPISKMGSSPRIINADAISTKYSQHMTRKEAENYYVEFVKKALGVK